MPAVSIELAGRQHLPEIPRIELAGATMFSETDLPKSIRYKVTHISFLEEAIKGKSLWVALSGEKAVGFAAASIVDGCGYLDEIDVMPNFTRQGIGTMLVTTAIDWARAESYPCLMLITFRHLAWNAPFYEKLGFEVMDPAEHGEELAGLIEDERRIGINTSNRVVMRRFL
jgi:GNAT superfamily N-acetyltransferase